MTITGLLSRFFLSYLFFLVSIGFALNYFEVNGTSWSNLPALTAAIYWACLSFGRKNRRYLTKKEKITTVWGMICIDLLLHIVFAAIDLPRTHSHLEVKIQLPLLALMGVLHAFVIYYFVDANRKLLVTQKIISE